MRPVASVALFHLLNRHAKRRVIRRFITTASFTGWPRCAGTFANSGVRLETFEKAGLSRLIVFTFRGADP